MFLVEMVKLLHQRELQKRAKSKIDQTINYSLTSNNCHIFTSGCLTGDFKNKDNWFSLLEETVEKRN